MNYFKKVRNNYVINQVRKANIPHFEKDEMSRLEMMFSGRVQKVGFRLEVSELAKVLGLTGYCKNLDNGDVLAEIQGPRNKIDFLVSFMKSLKRIKITNIKIKEMNLIEDDQGFIKL